MGVGLLFLGLAAAPGTAMAASPGVSTGAPSGVTGTGATFNGTVNPEGETTRYGFWYADAGSEWCTSGGTSGTRYGGPDTALGFADSTSHPVSEGHPGLTPGQSVCYQVYASNASGTAVGSQVSFTTPNPAPVVTTGAASAITGTSATLNGTVNPQGRSTNYLFEYNLASSQWCQSGGATGSPASSSSTALGFSDSTAHAVSATVPTGNPGTSFCFRVAASNAGASAVGDFATFTTTASVVRTDPATSIINGGATLNGTINPQGSQQPTYRFDYGPSSSAWCMNGGTTEAPSTAGGAHFFAFTDSSDHPVSAAAVELTPSTSYCFRLVYGSQQGSLVTFTTPPPVTLSVNVTGPGTASDTTGDIFCRGTAPHGPCTTAFVQGTDVTLSASTYYEDVGGDEGVKPGRFVGWSGACSGTERKCTVTMSGDTTVGATFASVSDTTDTTPPKTTITQARVKSKMRKATFEFTSSEQGSEFLCKLDKGNFKNCDSPKTYKELKPGKHKFEVAARDAAGNLDPSPAVEKFEIKK